MKSPICDLLDIEFPLIAFSHCRDVVVQVSKAGGFGVLGAARYNIEDLEVELNWIDENIDGMPYGIDLIAPTTMDVAGENETVEKSRREYRSSTRNLPVVFWSDTKSTQPMYT